MHELMCDRMVDEIRQEVEEAHRTTYDNGFAETCKR